MVMQNAVAADSSAMSDRDVLVALYEATDGPNWTNSENWVSDRPLREWYGVTTDGDGRVTGVDLASNQLAGDIPAEIGQLSMLRSLHIWHNQLTGQIPVELGQLANLQSLGLGDNQLTGEIPSELGQLANLRGLYLYDNQLTGEIPTELGQLGNLRSLNLGGGNQFTAIPPALGHAQRQSR